MLVSQYESSDLVLGDPVAEVGEALAHARQGDRLVGLECFGTESGDGLVGQQEVGQAADVEVVDDSVLGQHLVVAQPEVLVQLLEQHLNVPPNSAPARSGSGSRPPWRSAVGPPCPGPAACGRSCRG